MKPGDIVKIKIKAMRRPLRKHFKNIENLEEVYEIAKEAYKYNKDNVPENGYIWRILSEATNAIEPVWICESIITGKSARFYPRELELIAESKEEKIITESKE